MNQGLDGEPYEWEGHKAECTQKNEKCVEWESKH